MKKSAFAALTALVCFASADVAHAQAYKPFTPGDIFIDRNGDTLQVTKCKGQGTQTECQLRWIAESGNAPMDPTGRWWYLSTLRDSEKQWVNDGGEPYSGPAVPLPGAAPAAPAATPAPVTPDPAPLAAATPAGQCPRTPYGGPVSGTRAASATLFQANVADSYTQQTRAPYWYGVTFERFVVGKPVRNVVGAAPGGGATRVNNGAPVNATMYPVKSTHIVCEQSPGQAERRRVVSDYLCFVSAANEWTCGGEGLPVITQLR